MLPYIDRLTACGARQALTTGAQVTTASSARYTVQMKSTPS